MKLVFIQRKKLIFLVNVSFAGQNAQNQEFTTQNLDNSILQRESITIQQTVTQQFLTLDLSYNFSYK